MSDKENDIPVCLKFAAAFSGIAALCITIYQTYLKSGIYPAVSQPLLPITISSISSPIIVLSKTDSNSIDANQHENISLQDLNSFYFVDNFAFSNIEDAKRKLKSLNTKGYDRAGIFWIPDYPNLSGKRLFEVYPAKFRDRQSCADFIKFYRKQNPDAYCAFASKSSTDNPDRF